MTKYEKIKKTLEEIYKLEDKDNINEIRKEIWLEPLEEYFKRAPFEVEF